MVIAGFCGGGIPTAPIGCCDCGPLSFFLRTTRKIIAAAIIPRTARPPTTPPMIGPIGVLDLLLAVGVGVEELADVTVGALPVLVVVPTL
jgi:hypothetical protein